MECKKEGLDGVQFSEMSEENVREVQKLNAAVLPLAYDERFYRGVLRQASQRYCL